MTFSQLVSHPHALTTVKCVLISAIPVLFYAIWGSSLLEDIEAGPQEGEDAETRDAETVKTDLVKLVRVVYGFTLFGQVLAYLVCYEVAQLPNHLGWVVFVVALLVQGQVKFSLERRIRGLEATEKEQLGMTFKALFLLFAMMGGYTLLVHASALLFSTVATAFKLTPDGVTAAKMAGTFMGVIFAVCAAYVLAPWYMRKLLAAKKIADSATIAALDSHFTSAGLVPPEFWLLELENFGMHNALITGMMSGRGPLRPALFLSKSLLTEYSAAELRAVILHEVSHLKLRHLRTRFLTTFAVMFASCITAGLIIGASLTLLPKEIALFPIMFAALLPAVTPYLLVRSQVQRHEVEADAYAVFSLGADIDALISALRRLDRANAQGSDQKNPDSVLSVSSAHPTTEQRIAALKAEHKRRNPEHAADDVRKAA